MTEKYFSANRSPVANVFFLPFFLVLANAENTMGMLLRAGQRRRKKRQRTMLPNTETKKTLFECIRLAGFFALSYISD